MILERNPGKKRGACRPPAPLWLEDIRVNSFDEFTQFHLYSAFIIEDDGAGIYELLQRSRKQLIKVNEKGYCRISNVGMCTILKFDNGDYFRVASEVLSFFCFCFFTSSKRMIQRAGTQYIKINLKEIYTSLFLLFLVFVHFDRNVDVYSKKKNLHFCTLTMNDTEPV